jgi:hypothetical protein
MARSLSFSDSRLVFEGKSGRMKSETTAHPQVATPSTIYSDSVSSNQLGSPCRVTHEKPLPATQTMVTVEVA